MANETEVSNVDRDIAAELAEALENGDLFDEDSGDQLTTIDLVKDTPPASLSLYVNGFFYVYTIDRRYGYDPETNKPVIQSKDPFSDL